MANLWKELDKVSVPLEPLSDAVRGPFYDLPKELLKEFLVHVGAHHAYVGHLGAAVEDPIGRRWFRELNKQRFIHIPLRGRIVLYDTTNTQYADPGEREREEPLYEKIELKKDLKERGARYMGSVGPGQIAGLTEILVSYIARLHSTEKLLIPSLEERSRIIAESHVAHLQGRWLLAGFASSGAEIIRVPVKRLLDVLFGKDGEVPPRLLGEWGYSHEQFARRCEEDAIYRQALHLNTLALSARGLHDAVLALLLYDHAYADYGLDQLKDSTEKYLKIPGEQLEWEIGQKPGAVTKGLGLLDDAPCFRRKYSTSSEYYVDPLGLLDYYVRKLSLPQIGEEA